MKFWKVVAVAAAVVVLGTAAMAAVAVAQEGTDGVKDRLADLGQEFREAVAGILGISVDEYDAAVDQAREQVLDKAVEQGDLTQEQADRVRERADGGLGAGMMGRGMMGRGMMGRGMMGRMMDDSEDSLIAVAADKLGMDVDELKTQLKDGKTVADLAKEKGVDLQTIVDAFMTVRQGTLNQAVTDGKMTQEQADKMLENMREMIEERLNGEMPMYGHGGRGMMDDCDCGGDGDEL
jgi:polyhydroxyalkanoate synthesis regulator phasin